MSRRESRPRRSRARSFWESRTTPLHRSDTDEFYRQHAGELVFLLPRNVPQTVLELGCGNGALYPYLGFDSTDYTGVDASPAMLEAFQGKHPEVALKRAEASSYREDRTYDLIFSNGLVQYLDRRALRELVANARAMMHSGSRFVAGSVLWKSRRAEHFAGRLAPPYRVSVTTMAKSYARLLTKRDVDHWHSLEVFSHLATDNGMTSSFFGSSAYLYRFHAVMEIDS